MSDRRCSSVPCVVAVVFVVVVVVVVVAAAVVAVAVAVAAVVAVVVAAAVADYDDLFPLLGHWTTQSARKGCGCCCLPVLLRHSYCPPMFLARHLWRDEGPHGHCLTSPTGLPRLHCWASGSPASHCCGGWRSGSRHLQPCVRVGSVRAHRARGVHGAVPVLCGCFGGHMCDPGAQAQRLCVPW